ncbi:MAG: phage tail sheath family protein [Anaerolineales bacterium]|nr:phage tail sheath family protein [Anaerolineales bacterium]
MPQTTFMTPGVYVQEVDKGTKPIEAVGASIAAFIGMTKEASTKKIDPETGALVPDQDILKKPQLITSWTQFEQTYGGLSADIYMPDAVYGYFNNGGGPCYIVSVKTIGSDTPSLDIFDVTGKKVGFTVTAKDPMKVTDVIKIKITVEKDKNSFTMTVDDESRELTMEGLKQMAGADGVVRHLFTKVVISNIGTDTPKAGDYTLGRAPITLLQEGDILGSEADRTGLNGLTAFDDVKLLLCPDVMVGYKNTPEHQDRVRGIQGKLLAHCDLVKYCFTVLDTPPGMSVQAAKKWKKDFPNPSSRAALYYPWIWVADITGGQGKKLMPSSGHVVGVYNRVDNERGVHKAPANEVVQGALDLEIRLSKKDQEVLNPEGVNCIRAFPGRGIRIWGARTMSADPSWRYINVRRLFIVVGDSLDRGLQWVVFEPNDRTLWGKVRRDVRSFLRTMWLGGAFFGSTPDEAFYVKCDDDINPPEIRDLGQLIIEVGIAPVKPAEFVIVRLSQWAGPNAEA